MEQIHWTERQRRSDTPFHNMVGFLLTAMAVVYAFVAPAGCTQHLEAFGVGIDDRVSSQVIGRTLQLSLFVLRACKIINLVISTQKRRQMRKHGDLPVPVAVVGNRRSIYKNYVAVVNPQVLATHAANDAVARAQSLDPDRFFEPGIVVILATLGQGTLCKVEQAFELSDASAERSAAGCTIKLNPEPVKEYLRSNIVLMKNMIADGYADAKTLQRRIEKVEAWLAKPDLLEADKDAEYAAVIEIDLADITEPIVCCPNDPDDAKFLSEVAGTKIDEAFIGSCMTNIGHFRAAATVLGGARDIPVKLWVAPPTKMDASELMKEGHYANFGAAGARTEMPGCSLCMGNQAQVREGATVISTSTRNFPNRLGKNTNVFLGSAELAAVASKLGKLPTKEEYLAGTGVITAKADQIYKYMNFDQIEEYAEVAKTVA